MSIYNHKSVPSADNTLLTEELHILHVSQYYKYVQIVFKSREPIFYICQPYLLLLLMSKATIVNLLLYSHPILWPVIIYGHLSTLKHVRHKRVYFAPFALYTCTSNFTEARDTSHAYRQIRYCAT